MVAISGLVYMGTNIDKEYLYDAMPSKDKMDIRQEKQELQFGSNQWIQGIKYVCTERIFASPQIV